VSSRTRSRRPAERKRPNPVPGERAIVTQLHTWLAFASVLLIGLAGVEAGWRALRRSPPNDLTDRLQSLLLVLLAVTIAGGLGLLVAGGRPKEALHFVYAIVVLGALPIAAGLSRRASPRAQGIVSLVGALVALIVVARLFGTG
jgi:hypothetical protein